MLSEDSRSPLLGYPKLSRLPETEQALEQVTHMLRGFQVAKMLQVAAALDLPERVTEGPKHVEPLARECGANAAMLLRLCRALAAFGVFAVDRDGTVSQTARSAVLRRDAKPTLHHAAQYWISPGVWAAWGNLEHTMQTGEAAFEATFGRSHFDYLREHSQEARLFDSLMQHSPDDRHTAVAEAYDFSDAGLVVDVGGGNGALLAAILATNPSAYGVLFDQEAVVSAAPKLLGDLIQRCRIETGDFFESVPLGGDVYTLSQILHDWSDEQCLEILAKCRAAMSPQARLVVIERILDEKPEETDPVNFLADMQMMVLFPGAKERSAAEFESLLRGARFDCARFVPTRSSFWAIEARPVSDPKEL